MPTSEPTTTEPETPAARVLHCSFCSKSSKEVDKLIAGPGVYICDACVWMCNDILRQEHEGARLPEIAFWRDKTDEEILESLPKVAVMSAQVDAHMQTLVDLLRGRGVAWARIGAAVGVTRQSAWEKYSNEE
ncbi:MAG TPA: ClpX C4-type zinc finger protein [Pseudonocardiaceae bacterium]|jgi:ATP-dependent Clp protease ATP-binding subunit ClpX